MDNLTNNNLSAPTPKPWYKHRGLIAAFILLVVATVVCAIYYSKPQPQQQNLILTQHHPDTQKPIQSPTPSQQAVAPELPSPTPLASNSTDNKVDDEYGLFNQDPNNAIISISYYDHGLENLGDYAGYHVIVAAVKYDDPGGPQPIVFATKDYKSFLVDQSYQGYSASGIFNSDKVTGTANISLDSPPDTIDLGGFVLDLGQIDFQPSVGDELTSFAKGFTFYGADADNNYSRSFGDAGKYVDGPSNIYAEDPYGIYYDYTLLTKENYNRRLKPKEQYDSDFYSSSEINTSLSLYSSYGQLFPGGCGQTTNSYVLKDINLSDLMPVGKSSAGVDLYTLPDPNSVINKGHYDSKINNWPSDDPQPSFAEYIKKYPVLIFLDPFKRLVGIGEWQYMTAGGCGKPVVYLYPTKPTEVTVSFNNPMRFYSTMPTYSGSWHVLAEPNGELKDLQPELTNCQGINYSQDGLGYAQSACQAGVYPYLYWSGQTSNVYPKATDGWIIESKNLSSFLEGELTDMGLNEQEKSDMLSFWVSEMQKKNAPYYRVSFFQTRTMNEFVPMNIQPQPDTIFRIFLDWSPLSQMPATPIKPQILDKLTRKGFTLVEWGGLKQ